MRHAKHTLLWSEIYAEVKLYEVDVIFHPVYHCALEFVQVDELVGEYEVASEPLGRCEVEAYAGVECKAAAVLLADGVE